MYYLLLPSLKHRTEFIKNMKQRGVGTVFHYIPLHSAPAGLRFGRTHGELHVTDNLSARLVRLPLWVGMEDSMGEILSAADAALATALSCA
jgi:dTDP-4-amino-4,6-dideoxygalactose transaminase